MEHFEKEEHQRKIGGEQVTEAENGESGSLSESKLWVLLSIYLPIGPAFEMQIGQRCLSDAAPRKWRVLGFIEFSESRVAPRARKPRTNEIS